MSSVNATIDDLQRRTNELTSTGTQRLTAAQLAQVRSDMGGGIESAFNLAVNGNGTTVKAADKNSAVFKQKGLGSLDTYTQYWYDGIRNPKDYTLGAASQDPTPQDTADKVTTTATDATTTLVNQYKDLATQLTTTIADQKRDTTTLIDNLTTQFSNKQTDLLNGFQQAQAAQAAQMTALTKQMTDTVNGTGQAKKKPDYQAALARSRDLNSAGLGATMLTGPTGVAAGSMSLGATSLLGGK